MSRELVLLEDLQGHRPDEGVSIALVRSHGRHDQPIPGIYENLLERSFLVPPEFRNQCTGRIQIDRFNWWSERGLVNESGHYDPDEERTIDGVPMEIMVRWRAFDG